jgi:hypothetical protein
VLTEPIHSRFENNRPFENHSPFENHRLLRTNIPGMTQKRNNHDND